MGGRQLVPLPAPGQKLLERHVGDVREGTVCVAMVDVGREVAAVHLASVDKTVRAHDARVPDVDDVGVDDVEGDTEGDESKGPESDDAKRQVRHERASRRPAANS
ncbi:hypothetical protein HRbin41_01318 [bacterium HR41]|nr:hypothetical protein HRbin41_01318 [bacterium HR41]